MAETMNELIERTLAEYQPPEMRAAVRIMRSDVPLSRLLASNPDPSPRRWTVLPVEVK